MSPAEYNALGITQPEANSISEPREDRFDASDIELALEGLPLRVESLLSPGYRSQSWIVRTTAEFCSVRPEQNLVAKLTDTQTADGLDFFDRSSSGASSTILVPIYRQRLANNRLLLINPHLPLGSLRERMHGTRFTNAQIRQIVQQLATALSQLNRVDPNRILAHGDLKPENVLVESVDPLEIRLSDFDHSLWVPKESTRLHEGILTRKYAAPEANSGLWSCTSDMWSLGMLLLELLCGSHPFAGLNDESVRGRLTTWAPDDKTLEGLDDNWRALLLGLLDTRYENRWRPAQVELWLAGDRDTIAEGLARAPREISASSPFDMNGHVVSTARSLAQAMVADWNNGIAALHSKELGTWLRDSLGAPVLVSRRERLVETTDLTDDDRLIRFAYFADPNLEPLWRRVRLSAPTLQQLASQALDGDPAAFDQLVSLRESTAVDSYSSLGIDAPRQLIGGWRLGWERYQTGWQRLREAGAPDARVPDEAAFPALVRLWLSDEERASLTARIEAQCSAVRFILRANWYFALGHDLPALPIEHQWILDSLDRSSLVETLVYARGHNPVEDEIRGPPRVTDEQLMNSVLFSHAVERLTRRLALDHRSREEVTLSTERPTQRLRIDASDGFWTRVTVPIGLAIRNIVWRFREWRARRRPEPNAPIADTASDETAADDTANISVTRLNLTLHERPNVPIGQIALIRWSLPANAQPVIHLGHIGLFARRISRQRIRRLPFRIYETPVPEFGGRRQRDTVALPHRGQMVISCFQPTDVWLRFRMPGRRGIVSSELFRLGVPTIPLLPAAENLSAIRGVLRETSLPQLLPLTKPNDAVVTYLPIDGRLAQVVLPPNLPTPSLEREVSFMHRRPELQLPLAVYLGLHRRRMRARRVVKNLVRIPYGSNRVFREKL